MQETFRPQEAEILFPGFKNQLLPQLIRSKNRLPKGIKKLVETVERRYKAVYEVVPTTPDEIRAMKEMQEILVRTFLASLEANFEQLPEKVKVMVDVMLSVRKGVRKVFSRMAEESENKAPEPNVVQFFVEKLSTVIKEIEKQKLFDFKTINGMTHFPNLPDQVKFMLLFKPFESLAETQHILPEDAMDVRSNREAAALALGKLLRINKRATTAFYGNVARGQRENLGGPQQPGVSLWMKYLQSKNKNAKKSS